VARVKTFSFTGIKKFDETKYDGAAKAAAGDWPFDSTKLDDLPSILRALRDCARFALGQAQNHAYGDHDNEPSLPA